MKKKKISYNPFKMWLAWLFSVPGLLFILFGLYDLFANGCPKNYALEFFSTDCRLTIFIGIVLFIPGFLLGWGIHSLCRWGWNK